MSIGEFLSRLLSRCEAIRGGAVRTSGATVHVAAHGSVRRWHLIIVVSEDQQHNPYAVVWVGEEKEIVAVADHRPGERKAERHAQLHAGELCDPEGSERRVHQVPRAGDGVRHLCGRGDHFGICTSGEWRIPAELQSHSAGPRGHHEQPEDGDLPGLVGVSGDGTTEDAPEHTSDPQDEARPRVWLFQPAAAHSDHDGGPLLERVLVHSVDSASADLHSVRRSGCLQGDQNVSHQVAVESASTALLVPPVSEVHRVQPGRAEGGAVSLVDRQAAPRLCVERDAGGIIVCGSVAEHEVGHLLADVGALGGRSDDQQVHQPVSGELPRPGLFHHARSSGVDRDQHDFGGTVPSHHCRASDAVLGLRIVAKREQMQPMSARLLLQRGLPEGALAVSSRGLQAPAERHEASGERCCARHQSSGKRDEEEVIPSLAVC